MSERRSSRSHGSVKYAGFDDGDESDDDFAVSSHPAKKQKSSKTDEAAKKSSKSVKNESMTLVRDVKKHVITSQNSTKTSRRAPLSEKVYERELQEALELSLFETGKSQDLVNQDLDNNKSQVYEALTSAADVITDSGQLVSSPGNICDEPHTMKSVNTTTKVTCSSQFAHGTVVVDDSIELVVSEKADSSTTQQAPTRRAHDRQACKKPRLVDRNDETDESDFDPDDDSDEDQSKENTESEDDDDETRSNTGRRSTKIKTVNPKRKNKSPAMASKTSKSIQIGSVKGARKTFDKPQPSGSSNMAAVSSSASSLCSNTPPLSVTKPSAVSTRSAPAPKVSSKKLASCLVSPWKPPARGSSDQVSAATVKSPSSGLRLGLSRNQRVKPLHPSVQVS